MKIISLSIEHYHTNVWDYTKIAVKVTLRTVDRSFLLFSHYILALPGYKAVAMPPNGLLDDAPLIF